MKIDNAMRLISAAQGQRVEIVDDDPHQLARAIKARLYRDGIKSGYSMVIEGKRLHVFKSKPPRRDRKLRSLKGK